MFFITVKARMRFSRLPALFKTTGITARMESRNGQRCATRYALGCDGEVLAQGWTQWAMMNFKSGVSRIV